MKPFYLSQFIIGLLGALAINFWLSQIAAVSFLTGVAVITLNVLGLQYIWSQVLGKKSVALTVLVIVFKYSLLMIWIFLVATKNWLPLGWFSLGLGTILISIFRTKT